MRIAICYTNGVMDENMTENRTGKTTAGPSRVKGKGRSAGRSLNVEHENPSSFLEDLENRILQAGAEDPEVAYV